jgi:DHA3 family macrolide efflux protein-like MFS transporter
MVFGAGTLAGGLLLSIWGGFKRRIITSLLGMIGLALGPLVAGLAPSAAFWALLAAWGLVGLAQPLANGPIMAIFQAVVPKEMQGRVLTLMGSVSGAMAPLGLAIAGPVADAFGLRTWYIAAGVATVAVIVTGLLVPQFMHIEDIPPPPV